MKATQPLHNLGQSQSWNDLMGVIQCEKCWAQAGGGPVKQKGV